MSIPGLSEANSVERQPAQDGVLVQSVATMVAVAILIGLGIWQWERREWKEGLIASLTQRLSAAPVALPAAGGWAKLGPDDEFLHFSLTATFENDKEGLVFTSGSSMRNDGGGPGYWVFTPARLPNGSVVMIDRGFVPEGHQDAKTRAEGQVTGPMTMVGVLRFPETPGLFTPPPDTAHNVWFSRDSAAIARAKGIDAAPFYIELESPQPPGGLPHVAQLMPVLPNNHLQYAVTWFGLAAMFVGGYVAWLFGSWRRRPVSV